MFRVLRCAMLAVSMVISIAAGAQQLTVGLSFETSSIDPHVSLVSANAATARHIFDPLILQDENQRLIPGLALSWTALDDTTWELRLRPGVKFHDGSDFTAEDVAFTLARAPAIPNSPGQYGIFRRVIAAVTASDPLTVRIKTNVPHPLMPNDLSILPIVSHRAAAGASPAGASVEDFNTGRAAVGTGPYRFVEWKIGQQLVLERNEGYWGDKPAWQRVVLRLISNPGARVAALLAKDVSAIEFVPPADRRDLRARPDVVLSEAPQNRITYLQVDSFRDQSPFVTDAAGRALDRNPLKDLRVRRAISKAINRAAIVDSVVDGAGVPGAQILPEGYYGISATLQPEPYDPEGARRLLAEAGYPNGFGLTLLGPNNRFPNDDKVALAIAQFLARIGIAAKVDTVPYSVVLTRAGSSEFALYLAGWGSETGEPAGPLRALVGTVDAASGWGSQNKGRYSNPSVDEILNRAFLTIDGRQRELLLQRTTELAMNDAAIIPLYFQLATWAMQKGIGYRARADGYTLAHQFTRTP